jgi:hypothetical protein
MYANGEKCTLTYGRGFKVLSTRGQGPWVLSKSYMNGKIGTHDTIWKT